MSVAEKVLEKLSEPGCIEWLHDIVMNRNKRRKEMQKK